MSTLDHLYHLWPQTPRHGKSPIEIPNVGRWNELTQLWTGLGYTRGAEIGIERGHFSKQQFQTNPNLHLLCVDPWLAYDGYREHVSQPKLDAFFEETVDRLAPYSKTIMRMTSEQAASAVPNRSLDYVYLDGNHGLLYVIQDLYLWLPKIRKGGMIAGHDYIQRRRGKYNAEVHVVEALHAYTQAFHIDRWFLCGTKAQVEGEVRDSARSWFWIIE
jgi:hypothetical protein